MFEALFILTTVDNGTRVARYQIGDLLGNVRRLRRFADPTWRPGNLITTFIATAAWGSMLYMGVSDANGGINAMVPIFGISNQLLAAGCLMLVTVCVVKAGLTKYAWIPAVPLVWDVAVTFTADFQKIFDPQLGYFAAASAWRARIDARALEGDALAAAHASLSNAYPDGALSVFFLVMMTAFLAVGVKTCVATVRARRYGAEFTSEEPFVESSWFAPSGLFATKLERKARAEYELMTGAALRADEDRDEDRVRGRRGAPARRRRRGAGMTGAGRAASWAARLWRGAVWYLRELSGEARYDHYVERMRREHPDRTPLGEREFLRERERHEREHPNTSCCCC